MIEEERGDGREGKEGKGGEEGGGGKGWVMNTLPTGRREVHLLLHYCMMQISSLWHALCVGLWYSV